MVVANTQKHDAHIRVGKQLSVCFRVATSADKMILGRLVYLLYRRPVGCVKRSIREGGPIEQWRTERGRREMEQAAYGLTAPVARTEALRDGPEANKWRVTRAPEVGSQRSEASGQISGIRSPASGSLLEVHMLVGTRFWFMAAFALVSLQRQVDRAVHVHFYDDGTLDARQREKLETLAAAVTFDHRVGIDERIERYLPEEKFPFIRERLRNYPNLKKLTDPHVGSVGPKLVLDADVLFFGQPVELLQWFDAPETILCATDVTESYGYSRALMEKLAGARIPTAINVGLTGLKSESLDWEQLEHWCRELITREKTNYYLEQALVAMLCATRPFTQLSLAKYLTGPSNEQVLRGEGAMQHYVDLSKKEYFRSAWKNFTVNP